MLAVVISDQTNPTFLPHPWIITMVAGHHLFHYLPSSVRSCYGRSWGPAACYDSWGLAACCDSWGQAAWRPPGRPGILPGTSHPLKG